MDTEEKWARIQAREQRRSEQYHKDRTCQSCGNPKNPDRPQGPHLSEKRELFSQTPQSVWDEYFENGYTWAQAIAMEFSYL